MTSNNVSRPPITRRSGKLRAWSTVNSRRGPAAGDHVAIGHAPRKQRVSRAEAVANVQTIKPAL